MSNPQDVRTAPMSSPEPPTPADLDWLGRRAKTVSISTPGCMEVDCRTVLWLLAEAEAAAACRVRDTEMLAGRREWEVGSYGAAIKTVWATSQEEAAALAGYGNQVRPVEDDATYYRKMAAALRGENARLREEVERLRDYGW